NLWKGLKNQFFKVSQKETKGSFPQAFPQVVENSRTIRKGCRKFTGKKQDLTVKRKMLKEKKIFPCKDF
ncbi:MAG: hypothetical protein II229_04375, partial [Clostridia bacterium]|nr:hypothetical protein [Clostridia bacterium]